MYIIIVVTAFLYILVYYVSVNQKTHKQFVAREIQVLFVVIAVALQIIIV